MTINNLIDFIDRQTNKGTTYSRSDGEEIRNEDEAVGFIRSFSHRDWLDLRSSKLIDRGDIWIEYMIHLLDRAYTEEARQMIIHIALTGTKSNFLAAMEYIHKFRRQISIYTWLKLKNRSTEISNIK